MPVTLESTGALGLAESRTRSLDGARRRRTRRRRCAAMLDRRGCNDDAQAVLLLEQPGPSVLAWAGMNGS
jgi:hypothetical protein